MEWGSPRGARAVWKTGKEMGVKPLAFVSRGPTKETRQKHPGDPILVLEYAFTRQFRER